VTLALYVPRASVVHRAPAGVKLAALAGLSVLVFAVPTLAVAAAAVALVVVLGLGAARLPAAVLVRQARAVALWLVALFVLHSIVTDPLTGAMTVLRLLALVLAAAVVTATTRVTEMVAFVEWICGPLRWVGVRPARIGLVIAMALRFIPLISERADRIREAQAARGGSVRGLRGLSAMVVPLLVQVLQLASTVSEALDARGADDVPMRRGEARAA
jgi:biotin transport system permease protein